MPISKYTMKVKTKQRILPQSNVCVQTAAATKRLTLKEKLDIFGNTLHTQSRPKVRREDQYHSHVGV